MSLRKTVEGELDNIDRDSTRYKGVAQREVRLFQEKYGQDYEACAFPTLFVTGRGYFDDASTLQKTGTRGRDLGPITSLHGYLTRENHRLRLALEKRVERPIGFTDEDSAGAAPAEF